MSERNFVDILSFFRTEATVPCERMVQWTFSLWAFRSVCPSANVLHSYYLYRLLLLLSSTTHHVYRFRSYSSSVNYRAAPAHAGTAVNWAKADFDTFSPCDLRPWPFDSKKTYRYRYRAEPSWTRMPNLVVLAWFAVQCYRADKQAHMQTGTKRPLTSSPMMGGRLRPPWMMVVMRRWLQLRFNGRSMGVRLLIKGHQGHSNVTRAADLAASCSHADLFIQVAMQQPGRDVGRRMVVARSNPSWNYDLLTLLTTTIRLRFDCDSTAVRLPYDCDSGSLSDIFVWRLSVWHLSVGPKSRTEKPGKTKIGTEAAHASDSDTTFGVKRSTFKVTRPLYSARP